MRLVSLVLTVAVLAATTTAHAVPIITIATRHLVPRRADQRVAVTVVDVDPITGEPLADPDLRVNITLRAAVNAGGPEAFDFNDDFFDGFGGPLGPAITGIDFDVSESRFGPSIYSGASVELNEFDPLTPQLIEANFEAGDADEAASNGLVAFLIFDTTGLGAGRHTLDLTSSPHGPSSFGLEIALGEPRTITVSSLADLTDDLFVDFDDLTILLSNWNEGLTRVEGNLINTLDSPTIDFDDLTFLLAEWTGPGPVGAPEPAAEAAVPEPSTLVLSALALMSLLALGRRRRSRAVAQASRL
ncbi:MAG: PEP-CTERM sorting domain-containing protein [Planctomycetes bacterium]|nr:PEP-CTERM sorting domain-containing protein [Planctomycetota bacterium]